MLARPLSTQLVGSYTKPAWLIRHQVVTTPYGDESFWRPEPEVRAQALDDATLLAIADQERAGLDVIGDGEVRRQRFDTYFLRFGGLDFDELGPWAMEQRDFSFRHDQALAWGTRVLDRAFEGVRAVRVVHVCYGYATIGRKRVDPNYARVLEAIA